MRFRSLPLVLVAALMSWLAGCATKTIALPLAGSGDLTVGVSGDPPVVTTAKAPSPTVAAPTPAARAEAPESTETTSAAD